MIWKPHGGRLAERILHLRRDPRAERAVGAAVQFVNQNPARPAVDGVVGGDALRIGIAARQRAAEIAARAVAHALGRVERAAVEEVVRRRGPRARQRRRHHVAGRPAGVPPVGGKDEIPPVAPLKQVGALVAREPARGGKGISHGPGLQVGAPGIGQASHRRIDRSGRDDHAVFVFRGIPEGEAVAERARPAVTGVALGREQEALVFGPCHAVGARGMQHHLIGLLLLAEGVVVAAVKRMEHAVLLDDRSGEDVAIERVVGPLAADGHALVVDRHEIPRHDLGPVPALLAGLELQMHEMETPLPEEGDDVGAQAVTGNARHAQARSRLVEIRGPCGGGGGRGVTAPRRGMAERETGSRRGRGRAQQEELQQIHDDVVPWWKCTRQRRDDCTKCDCRGAFPENRSTSMTRRILCLKRQPCIRSCEGRHALRGRSPRCGSSAPPGWRRSPRRPLFS